MCVLVICIPSYTFISASEQSTDVLHIVLNQGKLKCRRTYTEQDDYCTLTPKGVHSCDVISYQKQARLTTVLMDSMHVSTHYHFSPMQITHALRKLPYTRSNVMYKHYRHHKNGCRFD